MRSLILLATFSLCATVQAQVAVINGASFRPDQPVSAGSWAAAFGTFTGVSNTSASTVPLPKSLGGVSVTVGGVDAAINFVSAGQINFLIPQAATAGLLPVVVKTATATVNGNVRVATTGPGIFVIDTSATPGRGAVLNQDSTVNSSSNPARQGQVIQIYATGPGALSGPLTDGAVAPSSPLVNTRSTPQVFIGGVPATVQFSGMAPNLVGVWQINATVPAEAFLNGRVAVQVYIDGVDSNEVTIFAAR